MLSGTGISYGMNIFEKVFPSKTAEAHCDIPCGIYVTEPAETAAETVEKMVEKIQELTPPMPQDLAGKDALELKNKFNSMARYIAVKEEHAQICKEQILILWTDYFKPEHLEMFPELHDKVWKATKLCSQNKREVNADAAAELRKAVGEIAEMFKKAEASK